METGLIDAPRVAAVRVVLDTPQREISADWQYAAAGDAQTVELAAGDLARPRSAARGAALPHASSRARRASAKQAAYNAAMVIERIDSPADVKRLRRGRNRRPRQRNSRPARSNVRRQRRPPRPEPRRRRTDARAASRARSSRRQARLGRQPSDVRPQDPHRPARSFRDDSQGRRPLGLRDAQRIANTIRSAPDTPARRSPPRSAWRTARDLAGGDETVVAVIGDGALTGGLAYEALNNAGALKTQFIVILNDNEMSIAPNVGSIASYLSVLRTQAVCELRAPHGKGGARSHSARRRGEESDRRRRDRRDALYRPLRENGRHLRGARLSLHRPDRRPQLRRARRRATNRQRHSTARCCCTCARSKAKATSRPSAIRARFTASAPMRSSRATAARRAARARGRSSKTSSATR